MAVAASVPSSATAFGGRSFQCKARLARLAVANAKTVRRPMREHDLTPRRRRRFARTPGSARDDPIHPLGAKDVELHGPDQPWAEPCRRHAFESCQRSRHRSERPLATATDPASVAIAIAAGVACAALIRDAWSRRVVGYVTGRRIDARLAVASLRRGIALRRPLPGCVVHADRGSRYAPELHRDLLKAHGVVGSLGRRGPPHDTPQAESLRKTSKVEDASLAASETFEGVALGLPRFLDAYAETRLHSAPG